MKEYDKFKVQCIEFVIEENKIYAKNKLGETVAQICFEQICANTYNIYSTYVREEYRGNGLAKKLVDIAVEEITKKGKCVDASCSYAKYLLNKRGYKNE